MPLITVHTSSVEQTKVVAPIAGELKEFVAKQLTSESRELNKDEISIRVIHSEVGSTIADVEFIIIAHAYPDRVVNQDTICLAIKKFVEIRCAPFTVYVWLQLSELGHSA